MSILVDDRTRLLIQGMTGAEGRFHAAQMIDYGTQVVAGVTPGRGGQSCLDRPVYNTVREAVTESLHSRFLPEFLNRIDETIIFHPLNSKQIRKIVQLQVELLHKQLIDKGIDLEVTPAAIDAIAGQGYDPTFGARPLKRVIQQKIQNPLAVELLKREFTQGTQVKIDCQEGEFTFERVE